jgi:hypothetical protein
VDLLVCLGRTRNLRTKPWLVGWVGVQYVRTATTAAGARAVQIVYSSRRGSRDIEHVGSAHDEAEVEVEVLKAIAVEPLSEACCSA